MTQITIRPAHITDAHAMCDVINPLIVEGTTTAHRTLFDAKRAVAHYIEPEDYISCQVAVSANRLVGFQSLQWRDRDGLPDRTAEIASFVAHDQHGRGIGHLLFAATLEAARKAKVVVIDATIRADNVPGLAFYSKLGFIDHTLHKQRPLSDGTLVDRVQKLFWL